jgi:4'-phosphopantetheinyl transferase
VNAVGPESQLSADERARADRFVFALDRARFVAARGLLRAALGAALNLAPSQVRFRYTRSGRPRVDGDEPVAFNLAHSDDVIAIGLAVGNAGLALGVDIELARRLTDLDGVARAVFQAGELERLFATDVPAERVATFHRIWTRKEACMKATGDGFSLNPLSFGVDADAPAQHVLIPRVETDAPNAELVVHDLGFWRGCAGAVAVGSGDLKLEVLHDGLAKEAVGMP